jgi:pimeloyl-ACP methyl ester carboxylesterase
MGMRQVPEERRETFKRIINLIAEQDSKIMIAQWEDAVTFDGRSQLSEIKCPTLIIAGSRDQAIPIHHAEMLHKGIRGSKLVVLEGADHALIWEDSEKFLRTVEGFI